MKKQITQNSLSPGLTANFWHQPCCWPCALLDLRDLGATRNLILQDGRRLPISRSSGVVDTFVLPTSIVRDVEEITGGDSGAYGSDAVSGFVNFVTQTGS